MNVEIKGTGIYLPEKVVTSYEAEEMAGYSRLGARNGLVKMITGVETRHYAGENEYCSDIAYMAAKNAFLHSDYQTCYAYLLKILKISPSVKSCKRLFLLFCSFLKI